MDGLAAPADPGLGAVLGPSAAVALRDALRVRARRWASAVGGDRAYEATSVAAARAAVHGHRGPLLLAAPDVPGLDVALAMTALADLDAGCALALGLTHDARPYLIALSALDDELIEIMEAGFGGGVLSAFSDTGRTIGLLRSERRLVSAADARAFALDPLTPADLAVPLHELRASRLGGNEDR